MVVARRAKRKTWLTEPFLWKKKNFFVGLSVSVQFCMHCMPLQSFFMVCSNLRKIAILWPRFRRLLCNVTFLGWWKPSQKSLTLLNLPGYLLILPGRKQILIKRAIFSLGHGFIPVFTYLPPSSAAVRIYTGHQMSDCSLHSQPPNYCTQHVTCNLTKNSILGNKWDFPFTGLGSLPHRTG